MKEPSVEPIDDGLPTLRPYCRATMEDAKRWAEKYRNRASILKIAEEEGVAPSTISSWMRKVGVVLKSGQHFVAQPRIQIPRDLVDLASKNPNDLNAIWDNVFGVRVTHYGLEQFEKYLRFIRLHQEGKGVEEIAALLGAHRSTVAKWRKGTDMPYLAKIAHVAKEPPQSGWRWLPLFISAGGNEFRNWIQVPASIKSYGDIVDVIKQLQPSELAGVRGKALGVDRCTEFDKRLELFGYLLGFTLGDAGKLCSAQERFTSMNLDVQLSQKEKSNERLGELVCLCANTLGIAMDRIADKQPSGDTLMSEDPTPAFRWCSVRSPLIAWMFSVCLGLKAASRTSYDKVEMRWILTTPFNFRKRFIQGLADSDGSIKGYEFEIASMPNAIFVTELLVSLGLAGARTGYERGVPTRSRTSASVASRLPVFNEWVRGYRYLRLKGFQDSNQSQS
ncbi:MAG: helix-turn-helix domain-containing protein [Thaumarchaeota archaeon]|nr:helix-turn-helix domain-containing protein [Nitrososphaerota archaeon]